MKLIGQLNESKIEEVMKKKKEWTNEEREEKKER